VFFFLGSFYCTGDAAGRERDAHVSIVLVAVKERVSK
jgi:hypothetical protein